MNLLLPQQEIFRIDGDARGLTIRCTQGSLWVTQPGDYRDHILNAGDTFTVGQKGMIAIAALQDASLEMVPVKQSGPTSTFNLSMSPKWNRFQPRHFTKEEAPAYLSEATGCA